MTISTATPRQASGPCFRWNSRTWPAMIVNRQSALTLSGFSELSVHRHQSAELLASTLSVLLLFFDHSGRVKGKWHVASRRP